MSKPQYRYAHQQERKRWAPVVAAGEAYCTEPICLMRSRWIPPGTPWHLSHDAATGRWIGPSHRRCNLAESNRRRHLRLGRRAASKAAGTPTSGRWRL